MPNGLVNYSVVVRERNLLTNSINVIATEVVNDLILNVEEMVKPYTEYSVTVTAQTRGGVGGSVMASQVTPEESELIIFCV